MCGILGGHSITPITEPTALTMLSRLRSRGPDGAGIKLLDQGHTLLGHQRLSILDLSAAGAQPMSAQQGNLWLTYNGEIYNYPELRAELDSKGCHFRSSCDAEVILHGYSHWGVDVVNRLRGIFAFGIWDALQKSFFCARDHIGVKPLYYTTDPDHFFFASQTKALHGAPGFDPNVRVDAFGDYLSYGVVPWDRSIYEGVAQLPPAHILTWKDGQIETRRYWQLKCEPKIFDFDEAVTLVRDKLENAIESQLQSDVPIGTFLSGGIDSSLITAIAAKKIPSKLSTFTIGFNEEAYDERAYAKIAIEGLDTDHHEEVLCREEALALLPDLVESYDEPYALGSALPTLAVSRLANKHGIKVILGGDGADELFAGYLHHEKFHDRLKGRRMREHNAFFRRMNRLIRGISPPDPIGEYNLPAEGCLPSPAQKKLLTSDAASKLNADHRWRYRKFFRDDLAACTTAQNLDFHTYLVDEILGKVDRASMAYGVEARVPFLDLELVELAFSIDSSVIYRNRERKALLKAVAKPWLCDKVLTARKKGFSVPMATWLMQNGGQSRIWKILQSGSLASRGILDPDAVPPVLGEVDSVFTWQLYVAELWARRWLEGSLDASALLSK